MLVLSTVAVGPQHRAGLCVDARAQLSTSARLLGAEQAEEVGPGLHDAASADRTAAAVPRPGRDRASQAAAASLQFWKPHSPRGCVTRVPEVSRLPRVPSKRFSYYLQSLRY